MESRSRSGEYDVCVIGGGVLGCLIAMELSKLSLSCLLVEKNEDLCLGISKANSAVLYPGYDQKPGTRKSRFSVEGNRRTAEVCEALGVPVRRCGSMMAVCGGSGEKVLAKKYRNGALSSVPDLQMLSGADARRLEPGLSHAVTAALYSPHTAVVYPWRLGMAAAKQAESAGTEIRFRTTIRAIRRDGADAQRGRGRLHAGQLHAEEAGGVYILTAEDGSEFRAACIVNAAGIFAHQIRELLFAPKIRIRPSMADYLVYGREENPGLSHVIFYEPENGEKGITLIPNMNGTILAGATERPGTSVTASGIPFTEPEHATEREGLCFLRDRAAEIFPALAGAAPIRSFAGLRPNPYEVAINLNGELDDTGRSIHDLVIEKETPDGSFVSLLGIKTPGITASVPIAEYVAGIIAKACKAQIAPAVPIHSSVAEGTEGGSASGQKTARGKSVCDLSFSDKQDLAKQDPAYGNVVCRCEQVTEREVRDAVLAGAETAEGVKLRCGAGMGKCQGTRCRKQVETILKEEKVVRKEKCVQTEEDTRSEEITCRYLLVGAGVAGLSLAAELAQKDPSADILLVDREDGPGGVLVQCLHDGFPDIDTGKILTGTDYLDLLWKEVQKEVQAGRIRCLFGTHITELREEVSADGTEHTYPVVAVAATGNSWIRIRAEYGVLASGAIERTAGMLLLPGTRPSGVYTAGEVQRMLNLENRLPGRKAVLVGTGNMGLIIADLMIRKGMEVVRIIEKEDHVTASAGNVKKYLNTPGTVISMEKFLFGSEVERIQGTDRLQGISVRGTACKTQIYLACDTLVIAAGLLPDRQILKGNPGCCHGEAERIFLFGNCEHIYTSVSAMRIAARELAGEIAALQH